jgi:hypothetical protein
LTKARESVILASRKNQQSFLGYYTKECFFDENGNGKSVSHWQPFTLPKPPTV